MPVSFKYRAVFVHIPKTGGQSVSAMLGIPHGSSTHLYAEGFTHMTLPMIREHRKVDGYYVFTFVRNPYGKILSEYGWRMHNIRSRVYNEPTKIKMSFPVYMETLLHRWDKLTHVWREKAHVVPQVNFIEDGMDVFRFERFEEGCEAIRQRLGMNRETRHVNAGRYNAKHTDRTIEITRKLYGEDFKAFGYDIDDYHDFTGGK